MDYPQELLIRAPVLFAVGMKCFRASGRCESVWLHAAWLPNWRLLQGPETDIFADLEEAVNTLVGDPEITRYTLLVSPDGLFYDTNRLGGDHHIRTKSGRRFILSVRRGVRNDDKILLAIAY